MVYYNPATAELTTNTGASSSFNGGTITSPLIVNNSTGASSAVTGALQVVGGVGIGGGVFVGGAVTATNLTLNATSIALGTSANAGVSSITVGGSANTGASAYSVSVGHQAGGTGQGQQAVAIGYQAGQTNQGATSVAIGSNAGAGANAVAIGASSNSAASAYSVNVGFNAGQTSQNQGAVSVGYQAGQSSQGQYAIALGMYAGSVSQPQNSIIINASGSAQNAANAGFYVNPVRADATTSATTWAVYYNPATKELTTSTVTASTATNAGTAYATIGTHTAGTGLTGSTFNGSAPVTWSLNTATLMASAVNLAGGTPGQLHYQSAANTTLFLGPGTYGQFLMSTGASAPVYQSTLTQANGNIVITSNTPVTSTVTGGLQIVNGGMGIGGGLYVGGVVTATNMFIGPWSVTTSTSAGNNLTLNGTAPQVSLTNGSANYISFNINGVSAPTFNASSSGTKILLYPYVSSTSADFAIGISSGTLWTGVPNSGQQFQWFAGTSTIATLSGTGTFAVIGDIIGFSSDKRLKTDIRLITSATSKVISLTGIVYKWNDLANSLAGYNTHEDMVGLFAQDVQAVLPQAVKPAPFDTEQGVSKSGENYLTVQYEKVVPLLVEAIKEQQAMIEELRAQIQELKAKR